MDYRNGEIVNKLHQVLNDIKGFEVASNPKQGKMLVRYNDTTFYVKVEPLFNDTAEGKELESKSFDEIVDLNNYLLK